MGKLGEIVIAENVFQTTCRGCLGLDMRVGIDVGMAREFAMDAINQGFGHDS
jgi:hypothetical protein